MPLVLLLSLPLLVLSGVVHAAPQSDSAIASLSLSGSLSNPFGLVGITDGLINQLSEICSTILDDGVIQSRLKPNISDLNLVLQLDACRNVSVPLTQSSELWDLSGFSQDRPTVIFITGWRSTINKTYSGPVAKAFACRNDSNFMVSKLFSISLTVWFSNGSVSVHEVMEYFTAVYSEKAIVCLWLW